MCTCLLSSISIVVNSVLHLPTVSRATFLAAPAFLLCLWWLGVYCSAKMAWAEWRLSLEKTKLLWLQAGEKRMSDGKQALGVGRRGRVKAGEILLVLACGRQLACLCDINFLFFLQHGKPLASWPSQIQIDVPRQAKPTAFLYSISTFYTQGSLSQMAFFYHLCISIILNLLSPASTWSQRKSKWI